MGKTAGEMRQRFEDAKQLRAEVETYCRAHAPDLAVCAAMGIDNLAVQMRQIRTMTNETMASQLLANLAAAYHSALNYIRDDRARRLRRTIEINRAREQGRTPPHDMQELTHHHRSLERVVEAIEPVVRGRASLIRPRPDSRAPSSDPESRCRKMIIGWIDVRWRGLTDRDVAILSLLAGNGESWIRKRYAMANESGVRTHRPTVLEVVREEQKTIKKMRRRAFDERKRRRASSSGASGNKVGTRAVSGVPTNAQQSRGTHDACSIEPPPPTSALPTRRRVR